MHLTSSKITVNEAELIELLKAKDKSGFSMLYDNYAPALYGIVLKIVRIEETAQDVLQDCFVKIWKNIESYNSDKGTLFTWILNIARNTAIDKTRSKEYKNTRKSSSIENRVLEKNNNVKTEIDHIGLNSIVEKLKMEYREIIEVIYFKGYTHSEAAEELQLPLGTVKTRVKIALRELRKLTGN